MINYRRIRKRTNPYKMGLPSPYKQKTKSYTTQDKYISHSSKVGGGIEINRQRSHYPPPQIEFRDDPDLDEILNKSVDHYGKEFKKRVKEILEQMNQESNENLEDLRRELEADLESDRIHIENSDSESNPIPIENHIDDTEIELDEVPTAAEANQEDDISELVESINTEPEIPPEEAEFNPDLAELAEEVLENPVLADEVPPEIWSEIEVLVEDLEAEQEPDIEGIEPSYY